MNSQILKSVGRLVGPRVGMTGLKVQKYSPELMVVAGIATGIAAAIMFARAHKKSEEVFAPLKDELDDIKEEYSDSIDEANRRLDVIATEGGDPSLVEIPTSMELGRDLAPVYVKAAVVAVKLYGPAVLMGASSVAFVLASHGVMKGRNRALLSTVMLLQQGFAEYRRRVVETYGEDAEARLYHGYAAQTVNILETTEDGKTKKRTEVQTVAPENEITPLTYGRTFSNTNKNWGQSARSNQLTLELQQSQMNDILMYKGFLLLNTVYEALGFPETDYGCLVGWLKDGDGDGYVSFGLDKAINANGLAINRNTWELEFNPDGPIYDKVGVR